MFSQPQKFAIRNSNPVLFQSSLSRSYTNSTSPPPSPQDDSSSSYLNKFAKATAKRLPTVIIGKLVVAGVVENGTQPNVKIKENTFAPRPDIMEYLKQILRPDEDASYYHVICGEHGSNGKVDERPKWRRALEAFKSAGAVYKAKHNKPPVIVYDNISELLNVDPEVLDALQNDAKMNADHREYVAVFVSSEGSVPRRMESRSVWSRAKKPVIEIGDLSKEESMKYLTEKRKINEVDAKKLYELVGGRIVDLKTVADDFLAKQPFEVIKQQVFGTVFDNLEKAEMNPVSFEK
ncbi:unnamed protein product [Rhizophagus irregularis]|nr:unnamed protein product [Rhizophagus irregularis]CAB4445415.1 unnamed protein product [Rhizophagus irregularis]